ncbi:hypothetical protein Pla123a_06430 [Posidoniimonas polymericola]|uniref:Uncharacterized protein n=1 Tax=Posidoniimonas polymericola TaxID=2528002 RepID=A0A5C5ZF70_9BACT|nr:hypothetical protein [Posidoniimonas polymericola]TWT85836.1 hypothetical protein Pla123a_06430 [Posidoniimonas polymericola]
MFKQISAAVLCTLATAAPGHAQELESPLRFPLSAYGQTELDTQPAADAVAYTQYDERLTPVSLLQESCGCGVECGDSCAGGRDSCVDWVLPRSNLPLPLLKGMAEKSGTTLPLPLGTSFIWTEIDRNVAVSDVRLGLGSNPLTSVDRVAVPETTFHASSKIARIDLWVLPCVNLYGIVGHTRTTGNVAVTVDNFPLPSSPQAVLNVPVELEGTTAGWGCTSGIGGKDWFAMLDINKTWTDFSKLDSSLTALVITPRVGLVVDRPLFKGEVHIGAMWQDTAQTVELTVDHPLLGNGLHVQVDQFEPNPWNFLVGGLWALDERLQVMVEGGMGGRSYVVSGVTVRY